MWVIIIKPGGRPAATDVLKEIDRDDLRTSKQ
jgi:hypothetical protein